MQLVIETATAACSIALIGGAELIDERHELVGRGHAERLLPLVREMLGERRPDTILVDCGPGSFTGVRVGLAAGHGLAIGWRVPLTGYSSLALIAMSAPHGTDEIAVALHGGHGQLFVQTYACNPLRPLDQLRSLYPEQAAEALHAHHVLGSGADTLVSTRGFGEAADALPRAADARLLPASLRSLAARPIYGRAPDAKPAGSGVEGPQP
jgi:tRNA threonylcarbamoyl adenosine modification protein YeaZ